MLQRNTIRFNWQQRISKLDGNDNDQHEESHRIRNRSSEEKSKKQRKVEYIHNSFAIQQRSTIRNPKRSIPRKWTRQDKTGRAAKSSTVPIKRARKDKTRQVRTSKQRQDRSGQASKQARTSPGGTKQKATHKRPNPRNPTGNFPECELFYSYYNYSTSTSSAQKAAKGLGCVLRPNQSRRSSREF